MGEEEKVGHYCSAVLASSVLDQKTDASAHVSPELAVLDLNGVPGGVRTCNLPLRRGMLYPIELLRHRHRTGVQCWGRRAC